MRRCNTPLLSTLVITVVGICSFGADESNSKESSPPKELVARLSESILQHCPDALITVSDTEFLAKHETMQFTIHGVGKDGEFTSKTYQEEGPKDKGFLLRVSMSRGRGGLPQGISKLSMSRPYYERYFDAPFSSDGKHYYLVKFYSGYHIDKELARSIKAAIPQGKVSRPSPKNQNE